MASPFCSSEEPAAAEHKGDERLFRSVRTVLLSEVIEDLKAIGIGF